jgi:hypothetical protein
MIRPGVFRSGNGVVIYDVRQVQERLPHPVIKVLGHLYWKNGDIAIEPDLAFINGTPYLGAGDECDSGGCNYPESAVAACRAHLPPYGFERLIDIRNIHKPRHVTQLMLQADAPEN